MRWVNAVPKLGPNKFLHLNLKTHNQTFESMGGNSIFKYYTLELQGT